MSTGYKPDTDEYDQVMYKSLEEIANEEPDNAMLDEILEFYECQECLPLAQRIIWLSSLKEALGHIPNEIDIDYVELQLMVVLQDEQNKKMAYDNYRMRKDSERSSHSDFNNAIINR